VIELEDSTHASAPPDPARLDTPNAPGPAGAPARSALLDATVALVREVARTEVMPRFLRSSASRKGDGSVLTEADLSAQQALLPRLRALVDCPVVGEEMTPADQCRAWADGHAGLWCVDPLDGTTNFAAGLPFFAISVALLREGRPAVGVVYDPVRDEAFHAEAGAGAWVNDQRLPESRRSVPLRHCLAGLETKRLDRTLAARMAADGPFRSTRSLGSSALEWCYAAAGRFDLFLHGGQNLWDYAAGWLVLTEAGGHCSALEGGDFWQGEQWRRSMVAALDPALLAHWHEWLRGERA